MTASLHLALLIAQRNGGAAFDRESDFDIGMRMQRRTFSWLRRDDVGRERRALFLADKFVRHSDKRQLLEMGEAHAGKPMLVLPWNTFPRVPRAVF